MTETKAPTRAELLGLCKEAGLRATGWKKERMAEELGRLARPGPEPEAPQGEGEAPADPGDEEQEAAKRPDSERRTGWCFPTFPMWSHQHLGCPARDGRADCACPCHEDGWTRPPIPEGARLSKYAYEDRLARGELGEAELADLEKQRAGRLADAERLRDGATP